MAKYYYYFNSLFLIAVVVFFVIAFFLFANVTSGLFFTVLKKAFIFTIIDKKAFSKPWEQNYKRLVKDWHGPTSFFLEIELFFVCIAIVDK